MICLEENSIISILQKNNQTDKNEFRKIFALGLGIVCRRKR